MGNIEDKGNDDDFMNITKKEYQNLISELHEGRKTTKLLLKKNAELQTVKEDIAVMDLLKQTILMLDKRMDEDKEEILRLKGVLAKFQDGPGPFKET